MSGEFIKTFDLQVLEDRPSKSLMNQLDVSLQTSGFIVIVNHGLNSLLIGDLYFKIKKFFLLSEAVKKKYVVEEIIKNRGYLPIGFESVSKTLGNDFPHDLCEALVFSFTEDGAPNLYPDEICCLRNLILQYRDEVDRLGRKLLSIFSLSLGIEKSFFLNNYKTPRLNIRFAYYPHKDNKTILKQQLRYGPHHDYGVLTILKPDDSLGGLQVSDDFGEWHDVQCPEEGLIINCGDLLSLWTGKRWRSSLHRVVNPPVSSPPNQDRLSVVAFFDPDIDAVINPLSGILSNDSLSRVIAGDYILNKIKASIC